MFDKYAEGETLKIEEELDEVGTVIFEWNRSFNVVAYDEQEVRFRKEFILEDRSHNAFFDLIDEVAQNPQELLS